MRLGWRYILTKHGGRLPIRVKAVAEGSLIPVKNGMSHGCMYVVVSARCSVFRRCTALCVRACVHVYVCVRGCVCACDDVVSSAVRIVCSVPLLNNVATSLS